MGKGQVFEMQRCGHALALKSRTSSKEGVRQCKLTDTINDVICRVYGDDDLISKCVRWGLNCGRTQIQREAAEA